MGLDGCGSDCSDHSIGGIMTRRRTWSRRYETNILKTYARATDGDIDFGLHWYQQAHDAAKAIAGRCTTATTVEVIGVIAALSPGLSWGLNVLQAEQLLKAYETGAELPMVGSYGRKNVDKAVRILSHEWPLDVLGGNKVRAFFYNILFPTGESHVTIDRHAKALAINAPATRIGYASDNVLSTVKKSEYDYIAWHYEVIARRLGLIPSQLQAIVWVTWKRINESREEVSF